MGTIYRRKGKKVVWIKYYRNGKPYYESSHSNKKAVARKLLQKREGEISKGELPGMYFDKIRFDELARDFLTDYRVNRKKSADKAERLVRYLMKAFSGLRATDITTARIKDYTEDRMEEGFSNASINRELSALKRMFSLGRKSTPPKVGQAPYIPMLKESNTRAGFFEHGEYVRLKGALPAELRPLVAFAYFSGWRKGEILGLTWDKADLRNGVVRLNPGETKNDEARTLYLDQELLKEMQLLYARRHHGCPYVFHRGGSPIRDFRDSWDGACIKAGLWEMGKDEDGNEVKTPTKIFHDFRRTAVRNMVRSGVPERVAMKISGHKTRSVFDRYNIVNDNDLRVAAQKHQAYIESQESKPEISPKKGEVIPFRRPGQKNTQVANERSI